VSVDISVIIPQFGRSDLTIRCVESLLRNHSKFISLELLVVDDGSLRSDLAEIQKNVFPRTSLVRNSNNLGVTASWNRGASFANGKTLIFLNNDVISHGPWCEILSTSLQNDQCLIAGPELRTEQLIPSDFLSTFPDNQLLSGWCFAISKKHFHELNGFDERYRLYYSDTDFQLQLAKHYQFRRVIQAVSGLPITHLGHQTTTGLPTRSRQWNCDREAFLQKWKLRFQ
jgi:GT2 family glycosyltransferase